MNIGSFLTSAARRYPDRAALTSGGTSRTYTEIARRVDALAAALAELGLRQGERVVLCSHNRAEVIETFFACWKAGLVAVPVNAKLTVDEIAFLIADCGAAALVYDPHLAERADALPVAHGIGFGGEYETLLARHMGAPAADREVADDAPAWLFYTSGTTGRPKGAILTHANLAFMVVAWCADLHQLRPQDVVLHCAPLSHGAGFHALAAVARGAHAVVHERFDPAAVLDAVAAHGISTTWLVPTQIRMLLDHPGLDTADLSSLTHVVYGGAPMHAADIAEATRRIGRVFVQLYGQGESPMTISYLRRAEHDPDRPDVAVQASTGVARTGMEIRVVDAAGVSQRAGEIGEIVVRGPAVMAGYWNQPDATADALRGGWLHTGDLGKLDDRGHLYLLDRLKDMIITGGSNVYAREVEEVLLAHPAVHEAAVFGVPDRTWGELVTAAVVPGAEIAVEEVIEYCRENMPTFKRPRRIHLVDALPRNAYGKVLKRELRSRFGAPGAAPIPKATDRPGLLRPISAAERAGYQRDGAAVIRGVIAPEWVELLRDAMTRLLGRSDLPAQNYADDGEPRFFALAFAWLFDTALKEWACHGPLVELVRQLMPESSSITFFYDQIFVKEPGARTATPWHQDLSYLPVAGEQQVRIWVPLDTVTAESGAVQYLRGSHRWEVTYRPKGFKDTPAITESYVASSYADPPDFTAEYESHDWLVAETVPGDVVLHHPRTVHGSPGNHTDRHRRAITSFYLGDQASWDPRPGNMFDNPSLTGHVQPPDLIAGAPLACDLFPQVWPRRTEGAGQDVFRAEPSTNKSAP